MRLREIQWEGGKNVEEIVIWGIEPMKEVIEIWDERNQENAGMGPEDGRAVWCYYFMKRLIEDLEDYLMNIPRTDTKPELSVAEG